MNRANLICAVAFSFFYFNNSLGMNHINCDGVAATSLADGSATSNQLKKQRLGRKCVAAQATAIQSPTLNNATASEEDGLAITYGLDRREATLQLGRMTKGRTIFDFDLKTPLDTGQDPANFGDLDSLADKTSLSITIQGGGPRDVLFRSGEKSFERKTLFCNRYQKTLGITPTKDGDDCALEDLSTDRRTQLEYLDTILDPSALRYNVYGLEASIAPDTFEFVTLENLGQRQKRTETDYSLKAYFGRFFSPWTYASAAVRYQKSHKAQDKQQVCQPINTTGAQTCNEIVIGAPIESKTTQFVLSLARVNSKFAFNVDITHDFDTDVTGISVPIWLSKNDDNTFHRGIKLEWNDDTEDVTVSVFANMPFDVL